MKGTIAFLLRELRKVVEEEIEAGRIPRRDKEFHFAPDIIWPADGNFGLFYVKNREGYYWGTGKPIPLDSIELAQLIVELIGKNRKKIFKAFSEIKRAIEWVREGWKKYELEHQVIFSLLTILIETVEKQKQAGKLPSRTGIFYFSSHIRWPANTEHSFYYVEDRNRWDLPLRCLLNERDRKIVAWRIIEDARGDLRKILNSICVIEKAINELQGH